MRPVRHLGTAGLAACSSGGAHSRKAAPPPCRLRPAQPTSCRLPLDGAGLIVPAATLSSPPGSAHRWRPAPLPCGTASRTLPTASCCYQWIAGV